jgi:glutamate-1-semialdehyde 2,1-aminomutase
VEETAARYRVPARAEFVGGMWGFFLNEAPVRDYAAAKRSDAAGFARLFHALLARGVYLAPSAYEACFVSLAHDEETLAARPRRFDGAFAEAFGRA